MSRSLKLNGSFLFLGGFAVFYLHFKMQTVQKFALKP